ncbi:MAG: lipopolysaccharide biosynthesis protein [Methanosarcina sp.]
MNEYKTFAQRIGLIGVTNLILSLSNVILLPILTKSLSIEEYGVWAQFMVTIGIIPLTILLGLPFTLNRFLPSLKKKEDIQEAFYSIFFVVTFISMIVSFVIYLFSDTIASLLFDDNVNIINILCLTLFIECLNNLFFNYLRATQQIKKYSILLLIQTLLNIIFVSLFVFTGQGILGAMMGFIIKGIIVFLVLFFIIFYEIGFKIPKFLSLREYLEFGLPTIPSNLSSWIVDSSDRYVIGILMGAAFVGIYSPGYTLGNIINMFFAPFSFILPPVLSIHYDNNDFDQVGTILSYAIKYFTSIAIPSVLGLSLLSKPLLSILTTPEIASQGYLITPFTALSSFLFGLYGIISHICILEKKTKIIGKIWITSALLNLILNFVFIPYIGILGAAITTLIAYLFSFIISYQYCSKLFTFDIKIEFIMKSILSSLLMSLIIIEMKPDGLYDILLTIGLCTISYGVIMILLKGFEKEELDFFKSIIKV